MHHGWRANDPRRSLGGRPLALAGFRHSVGIMITQGLQVEPRPNETTDQAMAKVVTTPVILQVLRRVRQRRRAVTVV